MSNYYREAPINLVFKIMTVVILFDIAYFLVAVIEEFYLDLSEKAYFFLSYSAIIHFSLIFIQLFIILYIFAYWYISYFLVKDDYILRRLGLIIKNEKIVKYANIRSVDYKQGVFGRMLNFGNIVLELIGEGDNVVIKNIDSPEHVVRKIEQFKGSVLNNINA